MKVGWIGLGKLGLPCALTLSQCHDVWGYDRLERPWRQLGGQEALMREEGLRKLLDDGAQISRAQDVAEIVKRTDIVFVAVQTPHRPEFGGEQPMPPFDARADFEYQFLVSACRKVARAAFEQKRPVTLVVVSTVLPGTTDRLIRPLLNAYVRLVYSPQFIAMGTTIRDFTNPEFVICGVDGGSGQAAAALRDVFLPLHDSDKRFICDITTAEAIKVFYNTFISLKIVWANQVMEMCHKTGADADLVVDALAMATDRIISPKYMYGGMGDGGACHPRDLIALGWLEQQLCMGVQLFGDLARYREQQTKWLASQVRHYVLLTGKKVVILGKSYKAGSDLKDGSPALLLRHYLQDLSPWQYDPHTGEMPVAALHNNVARVYVIATCHQDWTSFDFKPGSVVIDPFGYIPDVEDVTVVRVGRHTHG